MFAGGSRRDFRALGDKWLRTFVRLADLKPDDGVLDAGSGVGRMAVALTRVRNRCQETLSIRKAARARAYHLWAWSGRPNPASQHSQEIVVSEK
jgi:hypothetical protein